MVRTFGSTAHPGPTVPQHSTPPRGSWEPCEDHCPVQEERWGPWLLPCPLQAGDQLAWGVGGWGVESQVCMCPSQASESFFSTCLCFRGLEDTAGSEYVRTPVRSLCAGVQGRREVPCRGGVSLGAGWRRVTLESKEKAVLLFLLLGLRPGLRS